MWPGVSLGLIMDGLTVWLVVGDWDDWTWDGEHGEG
jgi:hypothetical protein